MTTEWEVAVHNATVAQMAAAESAATESALEEEDARGANGDAGDYFIDKYFSKFLEEEK